MSKLIIAEKPSVAKSIASALGASSRADGFYELEVTQVPAHLQNYIDYEAYGRDVALEENGTFTDQGYVRDIWRQITTSTVLLSSMWKVSRL